MYQIIDCKQLYNLIQWNLDDNILFPHNIINEDEYVTRFFFVLNELNLQNIFRNDVGRILDLSFCNDLVKASCDLAASPVSENSVHHKALGLSFFSFYSNISDGTLEYNFSLSYYIRVVDWSALTEDEDPNRIYSCISYHFNMDMDMECP